MLGRLSAGLVMVLVIFSSASAEEAFAAETQKTQAKTTIRKSTARVSTTKHTSPAKKQVAHRGHGKSYLIPPPPPYAPSILPELAYARARGTKKKAVVQEAEKVESRYQQLGVQSAEGYEDPEPVKPNKYVTYWNKS